MTGGLMDFHKHQLAKSSIDDAVRDERGYQSVGRPTAGDDTGRKLLKRLGIPALYRNEDARFPGLLIPVWGAKGERVSWQYKPDRPPNDPQTGKPRKYASVAGQANVLDVHPRHNKSRLDGDVTRCPAIMDLGEPLWLTEGIKKADCLTSRGYCAVALNGIFGWRSRLGTLGDWEDIPLKGRRVVICFDADAKTNANVLRAMARLGAWLDSKGATVVYLLPPWWETAGEDGHKKLVEPKGVDDFFHMGGTTDQLFAAMTTQPPPVPGGPESDPEALAVETLVTEALDGAWLWCPGLGGGRGMSGWLAYQPSAGCWVPAPDAKLAEVVRLWIKGSHEHAVRVLADTARRGGGSEELKRLEALAGQWRARLNAAYIGKLATMARGLLLADVTDFDAHPDLLNCPNGVADLRTGARLEHDPEYRFTQVTGARFVPGACHPDWAKALEAIPDKARPYLALRFGQAATGHVPPDDGSLVNIGRGENGKTTITYALERALGGYFRWISDRAVTGDSSQHPTELMDFRGARLAVIEELPDEAKLNMARVKKITGAVIQARYCGQDSAPYDTSHAFMINTNSLPLVTETDHGSWRRLIAVQWPYRYFKPHEMPDEPDEYDRLGEPGLRERLRAGEDGRAEAVLAWLVGNAVSWYLGGADLGGDGSGTEPSRRAPQTFGRAPSQLETAVKEWRASANPLFGFVAGELAGDPCSHIWTVELRSGFTDRLIDESHRAWSAKLFNQRLPDACGAFGIKLSRGQVTTGKTPGTTISRPEDRYQPPLPGHYEAWFGIRYKTAAERHAEAVEPEAETAADQAVTGITGTSGGNTRGGSSRKSPSVPVIPVTVGGTGQTAPVATPVLAAPDGLTAEQLALLARITCPDCSYPATCPRHAAGSNGQSS